MRRVVWLSLLAITLLVAATTSAWAHPGVPAAGAPDRLAVPGPLAFSPVSPAPAAPAIPPGRSPDAPAAVWALLLVLAVGLGAGARLRRVVTALVVVLLVTFVFEGAIHSVHHLGDRQDAPRCVVEPVSSHLSGAVLQLDGIEAPAAMRVTAPFRPAFPARQQRFDPGRDRAPPLTV